MGYGLPLQIRSVRLIQHGDVFEEVSPSVRHELESGRYEDCGEGLRYSLHVHVLKKSCKSIKIVSKQQKCYISFKNPNFIDGYYIILLGRLNCSHKD